MNLRMILPDPAHQGIHILLNLKVALSGPSVLQFYDKIRDSAEYAPARKTAGAHGNPLVDALYILITRVQPAVQEKGIQIHCLSAEAAGANPSAGFPVAPQFFCRKLFLSKSYGKHTSTFLNLL